MAGYGPEKIDVAGVTMVENPDFETIGELASLDKAREHFGNDNLIVYGDLIFRRHVLVDLLEVLGEITGVVGPQRRSASAGTMPRRVR